MNPHGIPHTPLKRARLPVPPPRQFRQLTVIIIRSPGLKVKGTEVRICVNKMEQYIKVLS